MKSLYLSLEEKLPETEESPEVDPPLEEPPFQVIPLSPEPPEFPELLLNDPAELEPELELPHELDPDPEFIPLLPLVDPFKKKTKKLRIKTKLIYRIFKCNCCKENHDDSYMYTAFAIDLFWNNIASRCNILLHQKMSIFVALCLTCL